MKNFTQKFIGLCVILFTITLTVNSQSIVSLPTPEYPLTLSSSDYTSCYEAEGSVYIRITDENGVRLNENTWNGASLEHDLDYGFPNESMSSFEISPGTYNYYVEALSYGECVSNPPHWAILLGEDTIVSGEAIYGLEGSFVVEESEIYGCTDVNALNYNEEATADDGSCVAVVKGCMDSTAFNFDSQANTSVSSPEINNTYFTNVEYTGFTTHTNDYTDGEATLSMLEGEYLTFTEYEIQSGGTSRLTINDGQIFSLNSIDIFLIAHLGGGDPFLCEMLGVDFYNMNYDTDYTSCDDISAPIGLIITTSNGDEYSYEASWGNNSQFVPILNVNWIDFKSVNSKIHLLGFDVYSSGSLCIPVIEGCTDINYFEYTYSANTDDGSCINQIIN